MNYCITTAGATASNSQFTFINSAGTTVYSLFTNKGRYFVNILNSLGYALPQGVDLQSGSNWLANVSSVKLSAYPLLAFFKLYNDYMSQSQRFNTSVLSTILQCIKFNKAYGSDYLTTGFMTGPLIKAMFDSLYLNYDNDYFTSA